MTLQQIEIDDDAIDLFRRLGADAEREIRRWVDDLNAVIRADPRDPEIRRVARERGCHPNTIRNRLGRVAREGIRGLVDRRRLRAATPATVGGGTKSPEFREYVQTLYRRFDRNNAGREVYDQLLSEWRRWRKDPHNPDLVIPGYQSPPPPDPSVQYRHPRGWSRRSIANLRPGDYDLARSRRGPHAANQLLAPYRTTRVGLKVGQIYMLDDQEYDNYVILGRRRTRPLGLMSVDVFSGAIVNAGYRFKRPDAEPGEKKLNSRDTLWLIVGLLTSVGYLPEGTQIVVEAGTASVSDQLAERISEATGGAVTINRGEVSQEKVKGLKGLARGNPRHKPGIESLFGRLRNAMGFLPAPTGRNKDESHESNEALLRAEEKLHERAARHLSPERMADLRQRVLPASRFVPLAAAVNDVINHDTDHQLEGWKALGFETVEYRVGSEWCDETEFAALPDETQQLVLTRYERDTGIVRTRRLSRAEVWSSGERHLRRLDPFSWHIIIPEEFALRRRIPSDSQLVVQDQEADPEPIVYEPYMLTVEGEDRPVPAGKEVLVYLNPFEPSQAILTDTERVLLGLVRRLRVGTRLEDEPLQRQRELRGKMKRDIGAGAAKFDAIEAARNRHIDRENQHLLEGGNPGDTIDVESTSDDTPRRPGEHEDVSAFTPPPAHATGDENDDIDLPDLY